MTPDVLDDLNHMRMNMLMMEKFDTTVEKDTKPINLDKVNELLEYDYEQDGFKSEPLNLIEQSTPDDMMNEAHFSRFVEYLKSFFIFKLLLLFMIMT